MEAHKAGGGALDVRHIFIIDPEIEDLGAGGGVEGAVLQRFKDGVPVGMNGNPVQPLGAAAQKVPIPVRIRQQGVWIINVAVDLAMEMFYKCPYSMGSRL